MHSPRVIQFGERSRYYAILDRDDEALAHTLAAHACVLQVRLKPRGQRIEADEILRVARMARRVCDAAGIPLVVNDRVDLALAAGADGVHLGQTDLPIEDARKIAGSKLFIGVSTHDLDQVRTACAAGADYLGFGPVFATSTKENPDRVQGVEGLRAAIGVSNRPIVAIGGIGIAAVSQLVAIGAAAVCLISAVNDAPAVDSAAQAVREASRPSRRPGRWI